MSIGQAIDIFFSIFVNKNKNILYRPQNKLQLRFVYVEQFSCFRSRHTMKELYWPVNQYMFMYSIRIVYLTKSTSMLSSQVESRN